MRRVSMDSTQVQSDAFHLSALVLAWSLLAVSCGGEPLSPADARDLARQRYELGKAAYNHGEFSAALDHFESAQALSFHPVTAQAIAECKARLGDVDGAISVLRDLLTSGQELVPPEAIENRIAELQWEKRSTS